MRQVYAGFGLCLLIIILFLHASQNGPDAFHYLAWAHSIFYDRDLSLLNQFEALDLADYHFTATGLVGELRNLGPALFWLPFYALSAAYTSGAIRDTIQLLFLSWATLLYMLLACGLMLAALQQFYSAKAAWSAVVLLCVGTPFAFYTLQQPISAHPASICLAALFLLLCLKKAKRPWLYFSIGIVAGWLLLLASYNGVVLLIPFTETLGKLIRDAKWRSWLLDNSALAIGALLGFLPQMLIWRLLYGSLLISPYARQMQWSDPYLVEVLLSPFHGLLIYAPLLFLVPLGLIFLARRNQTLAIGIGLSWLALTYLTGSNLAWWAGQSFGNRYFLVLSPFFAIAIGALLQQSYRWLWLMIPCCLWTMGLWLEYLGNVPMIISANRYYALSTLFVSQKLAWQSSPQLWFYTAQQWLINTPRLIIGEILLLSAAGYIGGYYALKFLGKLSARQHSYLLGTISVLAIGYVLFLSDRTVAAASATVPQRAITYDPFDLSESYMERAKYHVALGRPDLAAADAQKASQAWPSADRQVVGYKGYVSMSLSHALEAEYGPIRLLGYRWQAPNRLDLCWQKAKHDDENIYNPLLQIKAAKGELIEQRQLNDPFPAKLISIDYIFCDYFVLATQRPTEDVWFTVSFPAEQVDTQEPIKLIP